MKAVMSSVPEQVLEWRRRVGADRHDEMWEGVLHMPPMPNRDHDEFQFALRRSLGSLWAASREGRVATMNVALPGGWPNDYRVPDLILWTSKTDSRDRNTHFEGAPDVAIEIRSPGDESYEKLGFYARLGVAEVWVIDRDTKAPEVYVLRGSEYVLKACDADGWTSSDFAGLEFRSTTSGKLALRRRGDDASLEELP